MPRMTVNWLSVRASHLSGEIEACDHLIVEGTVEAALKGANMMDVSETGAVFGTVEIEEAVIAGRFEGDIIVNGRLTVRSTGVVMGTISYGEIAIEAGATLEGTISPLNCDSKYGEISFCHEESQRSLQRRRNQRKFKT